MYIYFIYISNIILFQINDMPITDKIKSRAIMETQTCQTAAQQSKPKKNEILNGNVDPAYTHSQVNIYIYIYICGCV